MEKGPVRRAYEQNRTQVQYWLQTKYPGIKQQAKEAGARIYWGDEMGLRSDHPVGRTWGVKGETPVVKVPGKRFGCNMISAISNLGNLNFMIFERRFNSKVFIDFMSRLVRQNEGPVFLLVEGHPFNGISAPINSPPASLFIATRITNTSIRSQAKTKICSELR